MTYKTRNATIVFAFVAMLMVAPLTQVAIAEESTSSVTPACGFTTGNIVMTAITRGAQQTESAEVTFTPTGGSNTATGTFSITPSTDWVGDGARATGTATLTSVSAGDTVVVNSNTYTAVAGTKSGNTQFSIDGSDAKDAEDLALSINSLDTNVRATTDATNVVTVNAFTRGTAGNAFTLSQTGGNVAVSGATLAGGGASPQVHLQAENTKFKITKDGTTTSQGTAYSAKIAMNEDDTIKEMVGATNMDKNLRVSFQTDTTATATPTGTVTAASAIVGNTVTFNGLTYTAISGDKGADDTKFNIDTSDSATATDLADSIDDDVRVGLYGDVTAVAVGDVVTITHGTAGTYGNQAPLASSGATLAVSAATLTGGAEPLENLPYDGALKMTVGFTVNCT